MKDPGRTILIVEDEPTIHTMYKLKLEMEGFSVLSAYNGEEGLQLAQKVRPNLILLDLKMPLLNGEEMLARMRSKKWGASIPVIVLTNISKDEAPKALQMLHISRYVVKAHYTPAQIVDIIKEIFLK